jgi:hypothetical protein
MRAASPRRLVLFALAFALGASACDSPSGGGDDDLPPDPGEQGKVTVAGIDSDNDGIRDDVQRHIVLTYEDEATRDALFQIARPHLESLVQAGDKQAVLAQTEEIVRGVACLYAVSSPAGARAALTELEGVMLNTRDRIRASIQADAQAGGETFHLPETTGTEACEGA